MGAIFETGGLTMGFAKLGFDGTGPGSPEQQMHDGDTATIAPAGNLSVRFLGVDAPEVSLALPAEDGKKGEFAWISDQRWEEFLADPFNDDPVLRKLDPGLREYLAPKVGPDAAKNHGILACGATRALKTEVEKDMAELGQDEKTFKFFLAFADEIMDGYGRFLAYLNRSQEEEPRPLSYNERLLQQGWVTPYFIWPNLNPFIRRPSVVAAVPQPHSGLPKGVSASAKQPLDDARAWVREARSAKKGVWGKKEPLRLFSFELRFLARRQLQDRWVIDLSAKDDRLLAPHLYYKVEHPEDRLLVPGQYVPLFVEEGWRRVRS